MPANYDHSENQYLDEVYGDDDLPDIILQAQTALDDLESALADPYNWPPALRQQAEDDLNFLADTIAAYFEDDILPDADAAARIISLTPEESE